MGVSSREIWKGGKYLQLNQTRFLLMPIWHCQKGLVMTFSGGVQTFQTPIVKSLKVLLA